MDDVVTPEIQPEKVIIPQTTDIQSDIIRHLESILSDLNYDTYTCCCCGWIDSTEKEWLNCNTCGERICEDCYVNHGQGECEIHCYNCEE